MKLLKQKRDGHIQILQKKKNSATKSLECEGFANDFLRMLGRDALEVLATG